MDKKAETKAIEKWLKLVDKPLLKKEEKRGRKVQRKNRISQKK